MSKRAFGLQMHVTAASKRRWLKYQTMLQTANEVKSFRSCYRSQDPGCQAICSRPLPLCHLNINAWDNMAILPTAIMAPTVVQDLAPSCVLSGRGSCDGAIEKCLPG